ncbi:uncharacterized protein LOC127789182 isoform X2 [Diospyros lotus]|uniref:uncharacterized protein LOC127789182 isoform X2 n=1 Tax=Diospyros lotus TaxID=55363 RepID=UPI00225B5800|nr:uncharacterized protein LOC127789182 isoform X2 [Diospyros lotus]
MASPVAFFVALFILFNFHVSADILFEDGYTVSTILDGHKSKLFPHSILPQFGSSDLIVLDSVNSAFYTVSFTSSQESEIEQLLDNGSGFSDGDLATAQFGKPKSFALDFNGNIYVADQNNNAIRKISKSGVTTIAGGGSRMGHKDGPGRNTSFSADFELAFVPARCALMICDRGHNLIRQINLKPQDCSRGSQSGLAGAPVWAWALVLGISCLIGLIIGFAVRPYIYPHTGKFQTTLLQRDMEALPNQSGETSTDVLLRHQKRSC